MVHPQTSRIHSLRVALALALAASPCAPLSAQTPAPPVPAAIPSVQEFATSNEPVRIELPGAGGALMFETATQAALDTSQGGLWARVTSGTVVVRVKTGSPAVSLSSGSLSFIVREGVGAFRADPRAETVEAMLVEGVGTISTSGRGTDPLHGGVNPTSGPSTGSVPLSPGKRLVVGPGGMEPVKAFTPAEVELVTAWKAKVSGTAEQNPWSVPLFQPTAGADTLNGQVHTMGSTRLALPTDHSKLVDESLVGGRDHLLVGLPGEGLGGAAFMIKFGESPTRELRNVIWVGSQAAVRFFLPTEELVTLVPGSVLVLTTTGGRVTRQTSVRWQLVSGAMRIQAQIIRAGRTLTLNELGDPLNETSVTGPVISREVLVAKDPGSHGSAAAALVPVREQLGSVVNFLGNQEGKGPIRAAYTILGRLPATSDILGRCMALQVVTAAQVQKVEITALSDVKAGQASSGAQTFTWPIGPLAGVPVAVAIPPSRDQSSGPTPEPFTVLLTQQKEDPWTLLRVVADPTLAKLLAPDPGTGWVRRVQNPTLWLGGIALILVLFPGLLGQLTMPLRRFFGLAGTGCSRCGYRVDMFLIGEFPASEDTHGLLALLYYDGISEVVVQDRCRAMILEKVRNRAGLLTRNAGDTFRMSASWCHRCLVGKIRAELVSDRRVVDESDCWVTSNDTFKLLQQIHHNPDGESSNAGRPDKDKAHD